MTFKFKFRKFLSPDDYAVCGVSGISETPAFSTSTEYTKYNEITGSGNLSTTWNNAIVLSAATTEEDLQDYFKREWVEEDGVDVYINGARKRKAVKNEIEMIIYQPNKKSIQSFVAITDTLNDWGIFEYYDNYNKGLKRLVYDGVSIIADRERNGMRVIHFKIKCNNILGYDNKNFNPSTGEALWS